MELNKVSLGSLGPLVGEPFDAEWSKVLANIMDQNTDAEAVREVKIVLKVAPNAKRSEATIAIQATSKTAPLEANTAHVFLGVKDGRAVSYMNDERQVDLAFSPEPKTGPVLAANGEGK